MSAFKMDSSMKEEEIYIIKIFYNLFISFNVILIAFITQDGIIFYSKKVRLVSLRLIREFMQGHPVGRLL